MSAKDLIDMLTGQLLKPRVTPDIDHANQNELLATCRTVLEQAEGERLIPAEEIAALRIQLAQMEAFSEATAAAIKSGDSAALDHLAEATSGVLPGMPTTFEPLPDIFDAIEDGDVARVRAALGAWDVNTPHGEYDRTPLYAAMSNSLGTSLEVIALLLDAGADPRKGLTETNVLHGLGFARLDSVAPEALAALITRCVSLGADLEERSNNLQWTPLHTALTEWNDIAVEALLIAGADPDARTGAQTGACFAGQCALDLALMRPKSFECLLAHGADPRAPDVHGTMLEERLAAEIDKEQDDAFRAELVACQALLRQALSPQ